MKLKQHMSAAFLLTVVGTVLTSLAEAEAPADCAINYTRTPCPGQEAESYKKCDGKKSCTKTVAADSVQSCQELAVQACSNDRLTVTASKVITATYKGKALKSKAGKDDLCLDYAKRDVEFNQCSKK
jgi:hypothetical protein